MNFKIVLLAVSLTVALVSAAPVQLDETETLPELESTGETHEETTDENGHGAQSLKRDAKEVTTETAESEPQPEEEKSIAAEEKSNEDNSSEGRKAFNSDMLHVVIGAVDGAVDVAVGAVNGAVDVALGTVTGAANIAAGTVTGAMGVISGTVDGTLSAIAGTISKPSPRPSTVPALYQAAYRPTHPQLAYPGLSTVSRPVTSLEQSNIVGTPPAPITSNAVSRELSITETDATPAVEEVAPVTSAVETEEMPMTDLFTVGASMSFDDARPVASTKPEIITVIGPPEVSPVVVEEMSAVIEEIPAPRTKPIIGEEMIANTNSEITPIVPSVVAETVETDAEEFTPITVGGFTPIIAPVIAEPRVIDATDMENQSTPIITGRVTADETTGVETSNTDEVTLPITAPMITEEIADTSDVTDDVVRDKRMTHDHEHGDCDDHSSHKTQE